MKPAVFLTLIFLACSPRGELTTDERKQVITEVRIALEEYNLRVKTDGLAAEFVYLDSSEIFFWIPPGATNPLLYDSIASMIRANAKRYRLIDNSFDTLTIFPLSKDLASYAGTINSFAIDVTAIETRFTLVESGTMIKRKDGWKLLNGQTRLLF